jgi:hypothetical protein
VFRPGGGEEERESWDSKLTYFLAIIDYDIGRNYLALPALSSEERKLLEYWYFHCFHPTCEKVSSVSRRTVWPIHSNNMSDP